MAIRIALVGLGKISVDEHVPAIGANDAFELVGAVSPDAPPSAIPTYRTLGELFSAMRVDAVAVNTPPVVRHNLALEALRAGKHVLLEKPPCATLSQLRCLGQVAAQGGLRLQAAWHSQHAPAIGPARAWLSGRLVRRVAVSWCEDARKWHPGQRWIWRAGGFGVFDPGINALSILVAILSEEILLERASFRVPVNCQAPSAASLSGRVGRHGRFEAFLDFLQLGGEIWSIDVETDGGMLSIGSGGATLAVNDEPVELEPSREYVGIYRRFAELIRVGGCEVDARPLQLVADAFLLADREPAPPFTE